MEVNINVDELYGDTALNLDFPESWKVTEMRMIGHDKPALTPKQIKDALSHPIGTPTIRELAKGKTGTIVVTCDDIQRPTPIHDIFPYVMEELHAAGISS